MHSQFHYHFYFPLQTELMQKLIKDKRIADSINITLKERLPLSHFLTFTTNLTPTVNFLSDSMIKEKASMLPL